MKQLVCRNSQEFIFKHENLLEGTIQGLYVDFAKNVNFDSWPWNCIFGVLKYQEPCFDNENSLWSSVKGQDWVPDTLRRQKMHFLTLGLKLKLLEKSTRRPLIYHRNNFNGRNQLTGTLIPPNYIISTSKDNVEFLEKIDV